MIYTYESISGRASDSCCSSTSTICVCAGFLGGGCAIGSIQGSGSTSGTRSASSSSNGSVSSQTCSSCGCTDGRLITTGGPSSAIGSGRGSVRRTSTISAGGLISSTCSGSTCRTCKSITTRDCCRAYICSTGTIFKKVSGTISSQLRVTC